MKGIIIVIEGIDGSGKNTQSSLLVKHIKSLGFKAEKISFPLYDETFFGKEVGNYLNGNFGHLNDIHPKLASMLYAGDRFEKKEFIEQKIQEGYILVMDRYVPSNVAHQAAKLEIPEREQLAQWIEKLEYEIYGMPKPDKIIFLNVPPKTSQKLILDKDTRTYTDKKKDLHEEDQSYLEKVHEYFCETSKIKEWDIIDCYRNNQLRQINEILDDLIISIEPSLRKLDRTD